MVIRPATENDVGDMGACAMRMFYESPHYRQFSIDAQKVVNMLCWLIDSEDGIAIVAEHDGKIVGGFIGSIATHWFGNHRAASDMALFVDKDHRRGRLAINIVNAAIQEAATKGADELIIANTTGVESDRVEKLFQHVGFERLGGIYYKALSE